ncbi:putative membrane protein YteJ [Brevibacillus agri]|uniref:Membrane protein YteJ n=1 Tax=Brevibacillus agri TaxID=51101 RepID=A0A3M8ASF8_9BACL|nr:MULTISPECIES: RDD family protein [Brevibacillus]EJL47793.1 putative membrane protein [Brevibacillus sp. CF112]MBG9568015.1 membrane protein [Brevibacillus agri]MBY0050696.1 RDD family protein [Brevibacillus agri]MCG5254363.1 RDD family protein [Brevibacillus agri]MDN4095158.1 RDD family protein [Brevibacillus agri]
MSDLMARQEPDGWQEPPREHHFAGFWIRVAASLLDSLFLVGVSLLVFNPLRRAMGVSGDFFSLIDLMEALFGLLYMILLTWWTGQTLGKLITGIRVISARQSRGNLSGGQVILREVIGKFLSTLPFGLGYLWVAWNPQKQGWHDLLAKTYVVYDRKT